MPYSFYPLQATGFTDASGAQRTIPFVVMVPGDKLPVYEETLEDNGRFNDQPALPFNAYGTMALARGEFETNSGSSQFFFLLKVRCHASGRGKVIRTFKRNALESLYQYIRLLPNSTLIRNPVCVHRSLS